MKRLSVIASLVGLLAASWTYAQETIPLPTPFKHYDTFNAQAVQFKLFGQLMQSIPPEQRPKLVAALGALQSGTAPKLSESDIQLLHVVLSNPELKAEILELIVHRSGILNLSGDDQIFARIFHDFLLIFLDSLSIDRLLDRLVGLVSIPGDAPRGERLLRLVDRTPTLQKVGQIIGRNPAVPEDMRASLQTLENAVTTLTIEEVIAIVREEVGDARLNRYKVEFGDRVLGEASIGAVIRCDLTLPGETTQRMAVCKVIKPYIVKNLNEELAILQKVVVYFEKNGAFYQFGNMPLSEIFGQIADALSKEIQVSQEQAHLREAHAFYGENGPIVVPELFPASTKNVTFMEFMDGGRITDAFPEDLKARAVMARRLSDALLFDVIFSDVDEPIFHADPHAGNVFYLNNSPEDPYRIALLDWGLRGLLPRRQRQQLVQLILGIALQDYDRLRDNVGALIEGGTPDDPKKIREIHDVVRQLLDELKGQKKEDADQTFEILQKLVERLISAGHALDVNLGLFVKSQVTIIGILDELDPTFDQDKYVMGKVTRMVMKESPKRFLQTIGFPENFTKHNYQSLISNADVWALVFKKMGGG